MTIQAVGDQDFAARVMASKLPVLVDFWATWCGPCRMAEPSLEEISEEYKEKLLVVKVNVDENPATASKYGVMSIPTTVLIKEGQEIGRTVGFSGKKPFEDLIKKGMGGD